MLLTGSGRLIAVLRRGAADGRISHAWRQFCWPAEKRSGSGHARLIKFKAAIGVALCALRKPVGEAFSVILCLCRSAVLSLAGLTRHLRASPEALRVARATSKQRRKGGGNENVSHGRNHIPPALTSQGGLNGYL